MPRGQDRRPRLVRSAATTWCARRWRPGCRPATARSRRGSGPTTPARAPIAYGDFSFEVAERGDQRRRHDADPGARPTTAGLTDARWHHIAVTVRGDDAHGVPRRRRLRHRARRRSTRPPRGELLGARIPAGATVRLRRDRASTRARSAPSASRPTSTPRTTRSRRSPYGLQVDNHQANTLTLSYDGLDRVLLRAAKQNLIDRYVAEAWRGDVLVATQSIADRRRATRPSAACPRAPTRQGARATTASARGRRRRSTRRPRAPRPRTADRPGRPPRALLAPRRDERHGRRPTAPATATRRSTTRPPTSAPTRARSRPTATARSPTAAPGTRRPTT